MVRLLQRAPFKFPFLKIITRLTSFLSTQVRSSTTSREVESIWFNKFLCCLAPPLTKYSAERAKDFIAGLD